MMVTPEELGVLCSCTVRYLVGLPRTGIAPVALYIDLIKLRAAEIPPAARRSIAEDIEEECVFGEVEDEMEQAEWLRLAAFLEATL